METKYNTTKWAKYTDPTVANEIDALQESGVRLDDILVNVTENGEWCWGEPTAMQKDEMESVMEECEMSTEGMLSGWEFYLKHKNPYLSELRRKSK